MDESEQFKPFDVETFLRIFDKKKGKKGRLVLCRAEGNLEYTPNTRFRVLRTPTALAMHGVVFSEHGTRYQAYVVSIGEPLKMAAEEAAAADGEDALGLNGTSWLTEEESGFDDNASDGEHALDSADNASDGEDALGCDESAYEESSERDSADSEAASGGAHGIASWCNSVEDAYALDEEYIAWLQLELAKMRLHQAERRGSPAWDLEELRGVRRALDAAHAAKRAARLALNPQPYFRVGGGFIG